MHKDNEQTPATPEIESREVGQVDADGAVFHTSFSGFYNTDDYEQEEFLDDKPEVETEIPVKTSTDNATSEDEVDETTPDVGDESEEVEGEEEEASIPEEELSEYSEAAIIALSLQKEGELPEEEEVVKDLSWNDLKTQIRDSALVEANTKVESYLESLGEMKKYVEFLAEGGSLETLSQAMDTSTFSTLDIESDTDDARNNVDKLLNAYYSDLNLPPDDAEKLIEDLKDSGKDLERAKIAQQHFKAKEDEALERDREQRKLQEQEQAKRTEQQYESIKNIIDNGVVGDFTLDKKDKRELHDAIFLPTEVIDTVDPNGKKVKVKVTKMQLLEHKFQQSLEQQVLFAKFLLSGFSTKQIKKKAIEERDDDLMDHLNSRVTNIKRSRKSRFPKSGPIQSRPVGEYYNQ